MGDGFIAITEATWTVRVVVAELLEASSGRLRGIGGVKSSDIEVWQLLGLEEGPEPDPSGSDQWSHRWSRGRSGGGHQSEEEDGSTSVQFVGNGNGTLQLSLSMHSITSLLKQQSDDGAELVLGSKISWGSINTTLSLQ
ncbi:hypothetical protein F3Y22_tig00111137pilonHSYRG00020 [Hibiscus syriacus]|uniref:Uncharacterized protein n=1 Tax=Hibiscus syriacus TaxID=106335 RepID=A0A6A2YYC9_HIBSY|nr:hypothetical protein F3Y22_tig00111137pilonHSYRG00020 [Hibiscus syriacus]